MVGAGYVGLVTAACMAELGHDVLAMDVDAEKIELLRAGGSPIYEPGLTELVAANRARIEFTTDPGEAYAFGEFIFLCVDTPPTPSGDADLSRIWQAVANLTSRPRRPHRGRQVHGAGRHRSADPVQVARAGSDSAPATPPTRSSCAKARP